MLNLRLLFTATLTVVLTTTALFAQQACDTSKLNAIDCDELCARQSTKPIWWVSADALFLDRNQSYSGVLAVSETSNPPTPILFGSDLQFSTVAGPRLAIGSTWKSGVDSELVFFGLHDWTSHTRVDGNNNLSMPGDIALATQDFFAADSIRVTYGSRLQNVEANLWIPVGGVEVLTGFRFFSLIDDLNYASFDSDTFQSAYQIQTNNQLYGGQIGIRRSWSNNFLRFRPEAKFGVFSNSDNQHSLLQDLDNTLTLRNVSVAGTNASTLSELRLVGDLSLTKNLKFDFGYNFLWVTGVAQAPYQLDFTDTATSSQFLADNHSVFYNGASVGLTLLR